MTRLNGWACHLHTEHDFPFELIVGTIWIRMEGIYGMGKWETIDQIKTDIGIDVRVPVFVIPLSRLHGSDHYLLFLS